MARSSQKKKFISINIVFDSVACDCEIGVIPLSKGIIKHMFHLYPRDEKLFFDYKAGKELVNVTKDGPAVDGEVLPDLLAIRDENVEDIKAFIEKHGFFLPLNLSENNSVDAEFLFTLINRLKATVSLMSALGANGEAIDYKKIIALTLYLLLAPQINIEFTSGHGQFATCPHDMGRVWSGIYQPPKGIKDLKPNDEWEFVDNTIDVTDIKPPAEDHPNYRTYVNSISQAKGQSLALGNYIPDSIRFRNVGLNMNEYLYAKDYYQNDPTSVRAKATILFSDAKIVEGHCRLAIDFLYNFCKDVGEIKAWNYKGELTFAQDASPETGRLENGLDEQLKAASLELAKLTLKTEITWNLRGIIPSYDTELMTPSWRVEHLLSGLYFCLFNTHAKAEQYRICAKPNCGRYFLAKTDSIKKRYCSYKCANATAQSVHRHKPKTSPIET